MGVVLDSTGRPVEGAAVRVVAAGEAPAGKQESKFVAEGKTGTGGRFSLVAAIDGHSILIVVTAHGFAPICLPVDPSVSRSVEFKLERGGAATACLKESPGGGPARSVAAVFEPDSPETAQCLRSAGNPNRSSTDEQGRVRWSDLPSGLYHLNVTDDRYLEALGQKVNVSEGTNLAIDCLPVRRGAAIEGRLVDRSGRASVPSPILAFAEGGRKDSAAVSSDPATGSFRISRLDPQRTYRLVVRGPECLEGVRHEVRPGGAAVTLMRSKGVPVDVEVRDGGTGRPISEFQLTSVPPTFPMDREASPAEMACLPQARAKDRSGKIRLEGLAPGPHTIAVTSPGYGNASQSVRAAAEPVTTAVVKLSRDGCRWIRLVDGKSSAPVDGAEVASEAEVFLDPQARALMPLVRSDAAGRLSFCPAYPGDRDFIVHHPLYAPHKVLLNKLENDAIQEVALSEGGSVVGKVMDGEGRPDAGIVLSVDQLGSHFETRTDSEGLFDLERLAAGAITIARAASTGAGASTRTVRVEEGRTVRVDFGTEAGETVRVYDGDEPVADARVILRSGTSGAYDTTRTRTDADGRFRFNRKKDAEVVAAIERSRYWAFLGVPAAAAEDDTVVRIPARVFHGRVVDGAKQPLRSLPLCTQAGGSARKEAAQDAGGPEVWLGGAGSTSVTDLQGRFELAVPAGARTITVYPPRGFPRAVPFPSGDGGDIVLEPRGTLRGRVAGSEGETSIGTIEGTVHAFALQRPASPDGTFELPDLGSEPFTLVAWAEGRAPYIEIGVVVAAGEESEREVSLTPGGRLSIHFASQEDAAEAGRDGFVTSGGFDVGWLLRQVASSGGADGANAGSEAVFPHVSPGSYRVRCGEKTKEVRVSEGGESVVECP